MTCLSPADLLEKGGCFVDSWLSGRRDAVVQAGSRD